MPAAIRQHMLENAASESADHVTVSIGVPRKPSRSIDSQCVTCSGGTASKKKRVNLDQWNADMEANT